MGEWPAGTGGAMTDGHKCFTLGIEAGADYDGN